MARMMAGLHPGLVFLAGLAVVIWAPSCC